MNAAATVQQIPVMAHLVLGYPTLADSLRTAETYIRAGVQVLELQIPFSHPTADGPVITTACREAVRQGVSVRDCIEAMAQLRARYPGQEIMVMSYLNRVFAFGFRAFAAEMRALGVRHLIVPDLPVDDGGWPADARESVSLVPVLAANISDARLEQLLARGFDFFYLMSDFKITGSSFSLHPRLHDVIARIRANGSRGTRPRIGIGFGISSPDQALLASREADLAIIGSALIQAQTAGRLEDYLDELKRAFAATGIV
jgi:tryptophan synthase alpha chain